MGWIRLKIFKFAYYGFDWKIAQLDPIQPMDIVKKRKKREKLVWTFDLLQPFKFQCKVSHSLLSSTTFWFIKSLRLFVFFFFYCFKLKLRLGAYRPSSTFSLLKWLIWFIHNLKKIKINKGLELVVLLDKGQQRRGSNDCDRSRYNVLMCGSVAKWKRRDN